MIWCIIVKIKALKNSYAVLEWLLRWPSQNQALYARSKLILRVLRRWLRNQKLFWKKLINVVKVSDIYAAKIKLKTNDRWDHLFSANSTKKMLALPNHQFLQFFFLSKNCVLKSINILLCHIIQFDLGQFCLMNLNSNCSILLLVVCY